MALGPDEHDEVAHDRLERAVELLRAERAPDWDEVSHWVAGRLRSVVRPAHLIRVWTPEEPSPRDSRLAVSSRVLLPALRRVVDSAEAVAETVDLTIESERLRAVCVELVCAFGADVRVVGDRVAEAVTGVVHDLLGHDPLFDPARHISVRVVDVVEGDPRQH